MDEISKSATPWFSLRPRGDGFGRSGSPEEVSSGNQTGSASPDGASGSRRQIQRALSPRARPLLIAEFVKQLRGILDEQTTVLQLLDRHPEWALPLLNRQYYAIRGAGGVLGLSNLVAVASRAEVLVNLLAEGILIRTSVHRRILLQTHALLEQLITHVATRGGDEACYPIAQIASCLYELLEPASSEYEPGCAKPGSPLH